MGKNALLIIDLQNDYYPGGKWELNEIEIASKKAATLLFSLPRIIASYSYSTH